EFAWSAWSGRSGLRNHECKRDLISKPQGRIHRSAPAALHREWVFSFLKENGQLYRRAIVKNAAVIVGPAGRVGEVEIELTSGIGDVHGPEQVVAGAKAGVVHQAKVEEETGLVKHAEDRVIALTLEAHEAVAALEIRGHVDEVHAPG